MKRLKRERKVKKKQNAVEEKKRKLHVQKSARKTHHKTFIQRELFEQPPAREQERSSRRNNLWIYGITVIIIIVLIMFIIRIVPGLKKATENTKSTPVVSSATAVGGQQIKQENVVTEKTQPLAVKKQIKIEIYFPLNKWEIQDLFLEEKDKLNTLVNELLKDKSHQELFVYGYADRAGLRSYNLLISEKRAKSIAEYLSEKTGIELNKIIIQGKGEVLEGPDGVSNSLFRKVEIINSE